METIPFEPLLDKRKRFRITEDGSITEFVDYNHEEASRYNVSTIDFWRGTEFKQATGIAERNKALDLHIGGTAAIETAKSDREKAIENLRFSLGEFSHLATVTTLLVQGEYLSLSTYGNRDAQPRGLYLPPVQLVDIHRSDMRCAGDVLERGIQQSTAMLLRRRVYMSGIQQLRRRWRLVNLRSLTSANIAPYIGEEGSVAPIGVDITYKSCGDALADKQPAVPLFIGSSGPVLSSDDLSRHLQTLKLCVVYSSSSVSDAASTGASDSVVLASVNAWDLEAAFPDASTIISPEIQLINDYLVRRQHDSFCRRLFSYLKSDASCLGCPLAVAAASQIDGRSCPTSSLASLASLSSALATNAAECIWSERLNAAIELGSVSQVRLSFKLSENTRLVCELVDLPTSGESSVTSPNLIDSYLELHSDVREVSHLLINILKGSLADAQNSLLLHFRQTLSEREAEKEKAKEKEIEKESGKDKPPAAAAVGELSDFSFVLESRPKNARKDVGTAAADSWASDRLPRVSVSLPSASQPRNTNILQTLVFAFRAQLHLHRLHRVFSQLTRLFHADDAAFSVLQIDRTSKSSAQMPSLCNDIAVHARLMVLQLTVVFNPSESAFAVKTSEESKCQQFSKLNLKLDSIPALTRLLDAIAAGVFSRAVFRSMPSSIAVTPYSTSGFLGRRTAGTDSSLFSTRSALAVQPTSDSPNRKVMRLTFEFSSTSSRQPFQEACERLLQQQHLSETVHVLGHSTACVDLVIAGDSPVSLPRELERIVCEAMPHVLHQ